MFPKNSVNFCEIRLFNREHSPALLSTHVLAVMPSPSVRGPLNASLVGVGDSLGDIDRLLAAVRPLVLYSPRLLRA